MSSFIPPYNDVTKDNIVSLQLAIKHTLSQASFISLDTEFTGLGGKEYDTRASNIEERYLNLCKVVKSHALVAIGLTTFEQTNAENLDVSSYRAHNFNFLVNCQVDHMISSKSMNFLAQSGFDFNRQIRLGMPYTPGTKVHTDVTSSKNIVPSTPTETALRSIFIHLLVVSQTQQTPIVIHNGFLDLIYLYHSLYTTVPEKLSKFIADLADMFPGGIYDTKYIADYETREKASFLSYLYRKYERAQKARVSCNQNIKRFSVDVQESISIPAIVKSAIAIEPSNKQSRSEDTKKIMVTNENCGLSTKKKKRECDTKAIDNDSRPYCEQYALHGFCDRNVDCDKSHDLDIILDYEEARSNPSKKLRIVSATQPLPTKPKPSIIVPAPVPEPLAYHSAYFDSFMTGYIFAHQLTEIGKDKIKMEHSNRLYLIGKSVPLRIEKSIYAKTSTNYETMKAIVGL